MSWLEEPELCVAPAGDVCWRLLGDVGVDRSGGSQGGQSRHDDVVPRKRLQQSSRMWLAMMATPSKLR